MKLPQSFTTVTPLSKFLAMILFVSLPFIGFYFGYKYKKSIVDLSLPTSSPTQNPTSQPSVSSITPDPKRYINNQLGISFIIPAGFSDKASGIKVDGNKIYVYDTDYPYDQGQYVEVFNKDTKDTLEQAIQKTLLANISPEDCFVKNYQFSQTNPYPSSYQLKTLGYKYDANSDLPFWAQENNCPKPYEESNGISYFLGDSLHSDTFLFVSIGQYGLPIEKNSTTMWEHTIQFL